MDWLFENYLFSQGFFVAFPSDDSEDSHPLEALFALAHFAEIRITQHPELAHPYMVRVAARNLGRNVPAPFYQGFPASVRELSPNQILLDRLVHYSMTYGLGLFSLEAHSVFERQFERLAFKENVTPKPFAILTQREAELELQRSVERLLSSTRPLNDESYALVRKFVRTYGWPKLTCSSKDTACRLIVDLRDPTLSDLIELPDVIRLVEWLLEENYPKMRLNKLNLRNRDRKLLTQVLDRLFARGNCKVLACLEKKRAWVGLLHHLHYQPRCDEAREFCNAMRDRTQRSALSTFERLVQAGDVTAASEHLLATKGPTTVARNMAYLISRASTPQEIESVLKAAACTNKIVLVQLIVYLQTAQPKFCREFNFVHMNRLRHHSETIEEADRRKSGLSNEAYTQLLARIKAALAQSCHATLGKVYANPGLRKTALPLQEASSQDGFGTLPRGTRISLPQGKKLRAFVYWEKVDDIDLGCMGLGEDGTLLTEFSWRTDTEPELDSESLVFSGDITSGWNGASEYFDLEPNAFKRDFPGLRYLVFCANVFTEGRSFSQCVCRAGYMMRDVDDSGEVFEPSTVQSSFTIDCNSSESFLFGFDLAENEFAWLNIAYHSTNRIAGDKSLKFLVDYLHVTEAINLYDFACMLASELVDTPEEADVVFSDDELALREDQEQIRSRNTARIMELLNS
ncbi:MAG: hypothetical protein Q4B54_08515 [Coriobacteriales bacterium]|nr:hypothetical protein [Coriobacteriales bacterium]